MASVMYVGTYTVQGVMSNTIKGLVGGFILFCLWIEIVNEFGGIPGWLRICLGVALFLLGLHLTLEGCMGGNDE
jgi:hypothetical protein